MAVTGQLKKCSRCSKWCPTSLFNKSKPSPDGLHPWCPACRQQSYQSRYATHGERIREESKWRTLKYRYGLTKDQYWAMHAAQGGVCAICKEPDLKRNLGVDHDHKCCDTDNKTCGKCVRGLLCNTCNQILGMARDNAARLLAAVSYLGADLTSR